MTKQDPRCPKCGDTMIARQFNFVAGEVSTVALGDTYRCETCVVAAEQDVPVSVDEAMVRAAVHVLRDWQTGASDAVTVVRRLRRMLGVPCA